MNESQSRVDFNNLTKFVLFFTVDSESLNSAENEQVPPLTAGDSQEKPLTAGDSQKPLKLVTAKRSPSQLVTARSSSNRETETILSMSFIT